MSKHATHHHDHSHDHSCAHAHDHAGRAPEAIRAADAQASRAMLLDALDDRPGPARDIVALNAGAALYVAGIADSIADGIARAREVIASGAARARMETFVRLTRELAGAA